MVFYSLGYSKGVYALGYRHCIVKAADIIILVGGYGLLLSARKLIVTYSSSILLGGSIAAQVYL